MKIFLIVILIVGSLLSCSKNENRLNGDFPHTYKLTKMTASFNGQEITGTDMEWQETYCLFENNTFIKTRIWNGNNTEATGMYSFTIIDNKSFIEFTYNVESTIIGSCYGNLKEIMDVISDTKIISTWSYCDGPGLEYERIAVCGTN
tara:strand:- start:425 stop:865 length:441 start_codon:yes stop_codon:yes gene_type:complete